MCGSSPATRAVSTLSAGSTWAGLSLVPTVTRTGAGRIDNASIYKADKVVQAIKASGAEVLLVHPYSLDYNPIEELCPSLRRC
jgi:hypothetical protein